jgi:antitoxin component YwqK of YwqJK toxin-antitoxin module
MLDLLNRLINQSDIIKDYYDSGALKSESTFRGGKRDGVTMAYYEDSKIKIEANFKEGKPHGRFREYYDNGNLMAEEIYSNGELMVQKHYDRDGELNGTIKNFYDNGRLKIEATFSAGRPHGKFLEFYDNGNLMAEEYYRNGALITQKKYNRNGKLVAPIKEFYDSGMIKTETDHDKGLFHEYTRSGTLKKSAQFKEGRPHGMIQEYYDDGALMAEDLYREGKLAGSRRYDRNGKMVSVTGKLVEKKEPAKEVSFADAELEHKIFEEVKASAASPAAMSRPSQIEDKARINEAKHAVEAEATRKETELNKEIKEQDYTDAQNDQFYLETRAVRQKVEPIAEKPKAFEPPIFEPQNMETTPRQKAASKFEAKEAPKPIFGFKEGSKVSYQAAEAQVTPGIDNGVKKEYYDNGTVRSEFTYVNGKKHGGAKKYYEDGKVMSEIVYEDDKLKTQTIYDKSGKFIYKENRK